MVRAKQAELKGMERPSFPDIDKAAEEYVEVRDERMLLTEQEVMKKQTLLRLCREHKVKVYKSDVHDPPLIVTVEKGEYSVKVSKQPLPVSSQSDSDADDEETDEEAAQALS